MNQNREIPSLHSPRQVGQGRSNYHPQKTGHSIQHPGTKRRNARVPRSVSSSPPEKLCQSQQCLTQVRRQQQQHHTRMSPPTCDQSLPAFFDKHNKGLQHACLAQGRSASLTQYLDPCDDALPVEAPPSLKYFRPRYPADPEKGFPKGDPNNPVPEFQSVAHMILIRDAQTKFHFAVCLAMADAGHDMDLRRKYFDVIMDEYMPAMRQLGLRDTQIVFFYHGRGEIEVGNQIWEAMKGQAVRQASGREVQQAVAAEKAIEQEWNKGREIVERQNCVKEWAEFARCQAEKCTTHQKWQDEEVSFPGEDCQQQKESTVADDGTKTPPDQPKEPKINRWDIDSTCGSARDKPVLDEEEWPNLGKLKQ